MLAPKKWNVLYKSPQLNFKDIPHKFILNMKLVIMNANNVLVVFFYYKYSATFYHVSSCICEHDNIDHQMS